MLGKPWLRGARHDVVPAASLLAALFFAASIYEAYTGSYAAATLLWLGSGAASAAVVARLYRVYEAARSAAVRALEAAGVEAPRPLIGYPVAVLAAVAAPPAAGLLGLAAVAGLEELVDRLYSAAGPGAEEVIKSMEGRLVDATAAAAAAVLPLLLPLAAAQLRLQAGGLFCTAWGLAAATPGSGLGDKPCLPDLVDVVVWAEPLGLTPDLEPLAEKWSIQD